MALTNGRHILGSGNPPNDSSHSIQKVFSLSKPKNIKEGTLLCFASKPSTLSNTEVFSCPKGIEDVFLENFD
nr:hypothetical protein CFP56_53773 [Quercus suber]